VNPFNHSKIYGMVQFLQSNDLFDLDWMDINEMTDEDILEHFGLSDQELSDLEKHAFLVEVTKQAQKFQTAEIVRSMFET